MKISDLFPDGFNRTWADHAFAQFGAVEEVAMEVTGDEERTVYVATDLGVVVLWLNRTGPRSSSTYNSTGRLVPWAAVGAISMETKTYFDERLPSDRWWSVLNVSVPGLELTANTDEHLRVRGLLEFAAACARHVAGDAPLA